MFALRRRESVGFAFLRSDERLDEVGGCLYLEVGEALGVAHVVVVALTRTDFAKALGYACVIRMLFFTLKIVKRLVHLTNKC